MKSIAKGPVAPAYIIGGREDFFRIESLARIREKVFGKSDPGPAFIAFDGQKTEGREVLDELRTLPLGVPHKLVIVENADKFVDANRPRISAYCEQPSKTSTLVLEMKDNPARARKKNADLLRHSVVIEADTLEDKRLLKWLRWRAKDAYGITLSPSVANRLIAATGVELMRLDSALGKLAPICAGGAATTDDIDSITAGSAAQNIFAFTEALGNRDTAKALDLLAVIFKDGMLDRYGSRDHNTESIGRQLLPMIRRELKLMWQAKRMAGSGITLGEMAGALHLPSGIVRRILGRAERFSERELDRAFDALMEAEHSRVQSSQPLRLILEMLVFRITLGSTPGSGSRRTERTATF
ncbi:MAG: DNA polymerase III subunit delta [Planctomycetota bacterium]